MFKNKKNTASSNSRESSSDVGGAINVIAIGTTIEGTVKSSEDMRVDGVVVGNISTDKRLVMGETGKIEGTADCVDSSIKGKIEGELKVKGLLHLLNTAFIKGKIKAKRMIVDEGAAYSGECLIGEQHFKS